MHEITVNLHMHTRYSDGHGLHSDIAAAAMRQNVDVVIVTDHNIFVEGFEGWREKDGKRLLMLIGQEVHDQARDPQKNHLLVFGANRDLATLAQNPQELINAVRESGGICFLAHPHETDAPLFGETDITWVNWEVSGFTGLEIWNHLSEFKTVIGNWPSALLHVYFPQLYGHGPNADTLKKWDALLAAGQHIAAIGGSDAHAIPYHLGPLKWIIFPYDFHFSALNTHLLIDSALTGETSADREAVLASLGAGRGWVGYDLIAPTRGFRFSAQGRESSATMGEEIPLGDGVMLEFSLPAAADVTLVQSGQTVEHLRRTQHGAFAISERGAYRLEVHKNYLGARRGWIFSNPIYVR